MPLTLHQLRIFSEVANHRNVSRAASDLHISQPALSQQLKLLEEDLGLKLYRKISRGIELTEQGKTFLGDIEPILLRVEQSKGRLKHSLQTQAPTLSIGGSLGPSLALDFFPKLLKAFKQKYPGVRIVFHTDRSQVIEQMVQKSEVEVAVISNPSRSPSLVYEVCRRQKLVVFATANDPLVNNNKEEPLTAAELMRIPLVIVAKKGKGGEISRTQEALRQLEKQGVKLNVVLQCNSPQVVMAAVKARIGLGIVFADVLAPDFKPLKLKLPKILDLKRDFESFIVYHKDKPLSPPARDFLALLRESRKNLK